MQTLKQPTTKGQRLDIRLDAESLAVFKKACNSIGLTAPQMVRLFISATNNDFKLKQKGANIKQNEDK